MTPTLAEPTPSRRSVRSAEEIAGDITAAIVERRLPAGARLKEEALARLYSVSRTKIRAALLMLSKDALIEIVPEKGACVSKLSSREAREIFAVRRILEAALAREFVQKAGAEDYRRFELHLAQERAALASNDMKLRSKLLADFHSLLAEVVDNQMLHDIIKKLTARASLIAMRKQSDHDAACSSDEHAMFIEVAKSGDVERAVDVMMRHLDHVQDALGFDDDAEDNDMDLVKALLV